MLPNFLIIGAPRSATTYLARCASEHPEIYVAFSDEYGSGDVHFFDVCTPVSLQENFKRGIEWYEQLFAAVSGETAVGEKTVHYLSDPKAPQLVKEYLPGVRLIAILRNPVDRAYSEFVYSEGRIPEHVDFLDACFSESSEHHGLLEVGCYYEQIQRYLRCFDRSRLLILLYDDLQVDALATLQEVFEFLGVDGTYAPAQRHQRINATLSEHHLSFHLRRAGRFVKRRFPGLFLAARQSRLTRWVEEKVGRDSDVDAGAPLYPSLAAQERTVLLNHYYHHNRRLSELLGRDLIRLWHAPPGDHQ
jgi:hypothetical protein